MAETCKKFEVYVQNIIRLCAYVNICELVFCCILDHLELLYIKNLIAGHNKFIVTSK